MILTNLAYKHKQLTKYNPFYLIYLIKLCYFVSIFQSSFINRNFFILHRFCNFVYFFNLVFVHKLYYNTPIYREILLQFLQFTEKYDINRTPFHFRHRTEAVLRRAASLSKTSGTASPSKSIKMFYTSS